MKKLIFASILSLVSIAAHSYPANMNYPHDIVFLKNLDVLKLSNVENSTLLIETAYPGAISYNCSMVMRTQNSSSMKAFLDRVEITVMGEQKLPVEKKGNVIWPLAQGGYLDGITIKTKDGKSIASNMAEAFTDEEVEIGLYADVCHKKPKDLHDSSESEKGNANTNS